MARTYRELPGDRRRLSAGDYAAAKSSALFSERPFRELLEEQRTLILADSRTSTTSTAPGSANSSVRIPASKIAAETLSYCI